MILSIEELEEVKKEAYKEGYEEGKNIGFENGYAQGMDFSDSCLEARIEELEEEVDKLKRAVEKKYPHWIDLTDYCPTAYGFGDNPTEPNWNYECSKCGHHIFTEFAPDQCPNCKANMNAVQKNGM